MTQKSRFIQSILTTLGRAEIAIYVIAAALLSVAAFIVLGYAVYDFVLHAFKLQIVDGVIKLLANLLLGLMAVELLYTVIVSIETRSLRPEPFIVVGLVAAMRRILIISVEGAQLFHSSLEEFKLVLWEIGLLSAMVIILVVSIYLLRKSHRFCGEEREPPQSPAS